MSSTPPDDDRTIVRPRDPDPAARAGGPTGTGAPADADASPDAEATAIEPRAAPESGATVTFQTAPPTSPVGKPTPLPGAASRPATSPPAAPGSAASSAGKSGNALPVGTFIGEFELLGVLGEGGFGIVYSAQDHSLQRRVALKEYMPAQLASRMDDSQVRVRSEPDRETFDLGMRSFINEARLLASFDHPSLVKVYRFWEANGTAYMVMQFVEGITLKDKLRQLGQPPDEAWLMGILAPLTEALSVIHAEHCYHRDIAPDNVILLAGSERPLLLDFGAARRVITDKAQALTVILKPGYAPVEQYAAVPEMKQGPWTDVYALAATVHYAITGRTPPPAVGRLLDDTFKPLETTAAGHYSPGFLRAIDKALKVRPDERTADMAGLRADLGLPPASLSAEAAHATVAATRAASAAASTASSPPAKASAPATRQPATAETGSAKSSKGLVMAAVAGLVVAGGTAAYLMSGAGKTDPAKPAIPSGPTVATAPSAPASVSAPVPAQKPFEIREEFNKVLAGQAADFKVQATSVKKSLRIGRDKLSFTVNSSRDGFVQVLVLGPDGSLILMFPNAQASNNAIKAGQTLTLPQAAWQLDTVEPAGVEDFLVVVSAQPRDYSDLSKERDYIFLKLPTGQRGAEAASRWTRSTPLLLGGLKSCPNPDCEAYGAATFGVDIVH
jgi:hypothetical protein